MRTLLCALAFALALAPRPSHAECAGTYPLQNLAKDLGVMQSSLRNLDEGGFRGAGDRLKAGLPCMAGPAPAQVYATVYRLLGALYHLEGDTAQAEAWFRTAIELDPDFSWDVRDFDVGHPIRTAYEYQTGAGDVEPVRVAGQILRLPSAGRLIMDGKLLDTAEATPNRPHVIQQVGADNTIVGTWIVDGNAFPAALLQPADGAAVATTLVIDDRPVKDRESEKSRKKKEKEREKEAEAREPEPAAVVQAEAPRAEKRKAREPEPAAVVQAEPPKEEQRPREPEPAAQVAQVEEPRPAEKPEKRSREPAAELLARAEEPQRAAVEPTPATVTVNPLDDVVNVERVRPPLKTPLILLGGASLLGAGGTYAASWFMHQRFEAAATTDEANQLRSTTNALVVASGGVAVLGVGLGYWGILLDGGVGIGVHRRF